MSLLNRLRPKWQNSDPEVRADAVRQLEKDEVELLTAVAQGDEDPRVRRIAIKRIEAPRTLLEIAKDDADESLRAFALKRAEQLLVQIASDDRDIEESKRALALLSTQEHLAGVSEKAKLDELRELAYSRLDEEGLSWLTRRGTDSRIRQRALSDVSSTETLRAIASDPRSGELALAALERIEDPEALEAIIDLHSLAKSLRRQASAKLDRLIDDSHPIRVKQRAAELQALVKRAEAVTAELPPDTGEMDRIATEWQAILARAASSELDEELSRRWSSCLEIVEGHRQKVKSRQLEADRIDEANRAETEARLAVIERIESLQGDTILQHLAEAEKEWKALAATEPSEEIRKRLTEAVAKAQTRHEELLKRRDDEAEVLKAESEAESLTAASAKQLRDRLAKRGPGMDEDLEERLSEVVRKLNAFEHGVTAQQAEKERATLARLEERCQRMEALLAQESISIKDADRELKGARDFLKNMGPLPTETNRKKARQRLIEARDKLTARTQQERQNEEWKRWANVDIQTSLTARVEALKESKDLPRVAKELRQIQEEWKKAGSAPTDKAEELWQKYKGLRDELRTRCDAFFEKQDVERRENLEKKEKLCEKVESLQDSSDWSKATEAIKTTQEDWKKIGPVPHKKSDAIWKRFRKACDHFFERRKGHYDVLKGHREENLKKKEALCEKAEAIRESTDWRATADALIALQAEWKTIGAVPRKKSDQIWKRFRAACDYFFDRYKRRDEVEQDAKNDKREELVKALEELDQREEASGQGERVLQLWADWKQLGPLPGSAGELRDRFEASVASLVAADPAGFKNSELDPGTNRKKRQRLCERMESLLDQLTPPAEKVESQNLADLAATLKNALASNTMTGHQAREKKTDWRGANEQFERLRTTWSRLGPVPGETGRELNERFDKACRSFKKAVAAEPRHPRSLSPVGKGSSRAARRGEGS